MKRLFSVLRFQLLVALLLPAGIPFRFRKEFLLLLDDHTVGEGVSVLPFVVLDVVMALLQDVRL